MADVAAQRDRLVGTEITLIGEIEIEAMHPFSRGIQIAVVDHGIDGRRVVGCAGEVRESGTGLRRDGHQHRGRWRTIDQILVERVGKDPADRLDRFRDPIAIVDMEDRHSGAEAGEPGGMPVERC